MKIFVLGAGEMGAWLAKTLSSDHAVAVRDREEEKLRALTSTRVIREPREIRAFGPDLLINAVGLSHMAGAFDEVLPYLPEACMLSDIASVKGSLSDFYGKTGRRFVSIHPMFGPTFARLAELEGETAVIIRESHEDGKRFFREFFKAHKIGIREMSFEEHDKAMAASLCVPFSASLVFAACVERQDAPGTTFRKHLAIARGLLSERDELLSEVLFTPQAVRQVEEINARLRYLTHIMRQRDYEEMAAFLAGVRKRIG